MSRARIRAMSGIEHEDRVTKEQNWIPKKDKLSLFDAREYGTKNQFEMLKLYRNRLDELRVKKNPCYRKCDAERSDESVVEIKKCTIKHLLRPSGHLYGEPVPSIKDGGKKYKSVFQDDGYREWGDILDRLFELYTSVDYWLAEFEKINDNLVDIQTIDGLVMAEHLRSWLRKTGTKEGSQRRIIVSVGIKENFKDIYQ